MDFKVAVIGSGLSGLVSIKALLAENIDVVGYEATDSIGGLWKPSNRAGDGEPSTHTAWEHLHTNLSKYSCSFSDFPWKTESSSLFPSQIEMHEYLNNFSNHFKLRELIKFRHRVTQVSRHGENNNEFLVKAINLSTGQETFEIFTHVIVATGYFSEPIIPTIHGINSNFKGKVYHSSTYTSNKAFRGRKVMVVGSSHSSAELSADIARQAQSVIHISPRTTWTLPRHLPIDPGSHSSHMLPLDFLFYKFNDSQLELLNQSSTSIEVVFKDTSSIAKSKHYLSTLIGEEPSQYDTSPDPFFVAISDSYASFVHSGIIDVHRGRVCTVSSTGDIIVQSNESLQSTFTVDDLVFCTGYKPMLQFLDKDILSKLFYEENDSFLQLLLSREIMHPDVPNLFFAGMYRGSYMSVVELQAVLISKYISSSIEIPSYDEMNGNLNIAHRIRRQNPRPQFPHPDFVGMVLDLARAVNQCPDMISLKKMKIALPYVFMDVQRSNAEIERNKIFEEVNRIYDDCMRGVNITAVILTRLEGLWNYTSSRKSCDPNEGKKQISFVMLIANQFKSSVIGETDIGACENIILNATYESINDLIEVKSLDGKHRLELRFRKSDGWIAESELLYNDIKIYIKFCVKFVGSFIKTVHIQINDGEQDIDTYLSRPMWP